MNNMSLQEITTACQGSYYGDPLFLKQEVSGVTIDSRKIEADYLFIPIRGARADGHDYIGQVMGAGALCTLSEEKLEGVNHPYILVDSCEQALKDLAEHYRTALGITVVGITGSVGKTSTKEMIASVLAQKYQVLKTAGNFNNEIGLPLTIFNLTTDHEIAILEMGINHFGEMTRLSKVARPDIAVITNIGQCHLEFLGDRDGVLKAKSEIFSYMNPEGTVILNGDDDKLRTVAGVYEVSPHFFYADAANASDADISDATYASDADISGATYASDIVNLGLAGTACTIHLSDERSFSCTIPIPGSHMVSNALAGASVGLELGLTNEEIKAGIEALVPVSGRNNIIRTESFTIIDDCYNANPVSMKASLDVIATATTRKVAILGDMGELGELEQQMHYEVGAYAGGKNLDMVCCIGALSKYMIQGLNETLAQNKSNCMVHAYDNKEDFLESLSSILISGDSILVKASNFMGFKEIVETIKLL